MSIKKGDTVDLVNKSIKEKIEDIVGFNRIKSLPTIGRAFNHDEPEAIGKASNLEGKELDMAFLKMKTLLRAEGIKTISEHIELMERAMLDDPSFLRFIITLFTSQNFREIFSKSLGHDVEVRNDKKVVVGNKL